MTKVGARVLFHFLVSGESVLRTRPAVVMAVYDGDRADLEVEITPEETAVWGYTSAQGHVPKATGRPSSGEWTTPRI